MSWVLTISQITFTILTTMCTVFDIVLLLSVIKQRFFTSSTSKTPFVYITAMTLSGIIGKFADFFMVDAWPIGDLIDPVNGYENYRKLIGKQITLIATYCYLIAIFLNCLMTCHRVSILCSPAKAPQWFTDIKLALYSMSIMLILFVVLLIPYYSECSLNFNARASFHEAACAPKRHQLTLIQNQYLIWVPVSAVTVNVSMILYIKFSRKFIKKPISLSLTTIKRENEMIRQACFIATEISIFEVGYLFMRLYPVIHIPETFPILID
nr:hypothetical protein F18E3.1 - Caenorhabditis elegans [Caenorhabditis elegans]